MIELYQFPLSHYCEKVRWVLDYKGLAYRCINLLPGLHLNKMKKISGRTSVPVLVDGQTVVRDSHKIIDYLEQTYSDKPVTPKQASQKKAVIAWEKFADEEVGPHVRRICYHYLLDRPDILIPIFSYQGPWYSAIYLKLAFPQLQKKMRHFMKISPQETEKSKQALEQAFIKINLRLAEAQFLGGDNFSRADIALASLLAPLIRPVNYGGKRAEFYPNALQAYVDSQSDNLIWVKNLYATKR